jgi:hypothetical protein
LPLPLPWVQRFSGVRRVHRLSAGFSKTGNPLIQGSLPLLCHPLIAFGLLRFGCMWLGKLFWNFILDFNRISKFFVYIYSAYYGLFNVG